MMQPRDAVVVLKKARSGQTVLQHYSSCSPARAVICIFTAFQALIGSDFLLCNFSTGLRWRVVTIEPSARERKGHPATLNDHASLIRHMKWLWSINTLVMQVRVEKVDFQHIHSTQRAS